MIKWDVWKSEKEIGIKGKNVFGVSHLLHSWSKYVFASSSLTTLYVWRHTHSCLHVLAEKIIRIYINHPNPDNNHWTTPKFKPLHCWVQINVLTTWALQAHKHCHVGCVLQLCYKSLQLLLTKLIFAGWGEKKKKKQLLRMPWQEHLF